MATPERIGRMDKLIDVFCREQHGAVHPNASVPVEQHGAKYIRKMGQINDAFLLLLHDFGRQRYIFLIIFSRYQNYRMRAGVHLYRVEARFGNVGHGIRSLPPAYPYRRVGSERTAVVVRASGIAGNQFLASGFG